jgi:hypothetical protein
MAGDTGGAGSDVRAELGRWVAVTREAVAAQAAWGRATVELARSAMSGDLDPAGATRAYADAARRESARYWRSASRLGADYARGLVELGGTVAGGVLDDVVRARRPAGSRRDGGSAGHRRAWSPPGSHPGGADDALDDDDAGGSGDAGGVGEEAGSASADTSSGTASLALRGRLGERATGSVTVANRHPRARRIELTAGPLTDVHGVEVIGARLDLEPAKATLAPGAEAVVAVGLDLAAGVVEAGRRYRCVLRVSGGDDATLDCTVDVDP